MKPQLRWPASMASAPRNFHRTRPGPNRWETAASCSKSCNRHAAEDIRFEAERSKPEKNPTETPSAAKPEITCDQSGFGQDQQLPLRMNLSEGVVSWKKPVIGFDSMCRGAIFHFPRILRQNTWLKIVPRRRSESCNLRRVRAAAGHPIYCGSHGYAFPYMAVGTEPMFY